MLQYYLARPGGEEREKKDLLYSLFYRNRKERRIHSEVSASTFRRGRGEKKRRSCFHLLIVKADEKREEANWKRRRKKEVSSYLCERRNHCSRLSWEYNERRERDLKEKLAPHLKRKKGKEERRFFAFFVRRKGKPESPLQSGGGKKKEKGGREIAPPIKWILAEENLVDYLPGGTERKEKNMPPSSPL